MPDEPVPSHAHDGGELGPKHGHEHPHPSAPTQAEHGHEHPTAPAEKLTGPQDHEHGHAHGPAGMPGLLAWLVESVPFLHDHKHGDLTLDEALESSSRGISALRISLVILGLTALVQLAVVVASGSVALLGDTVHNFTDAMTAVPLWIAFSLSRRTASRRFTYGYGRAEDIAGVIIVLVILSSALFAAYESYDRLIHPRALDHIGWVMVAALIGFTGNEAVAIFRISVGKAIGSAALVADGQHARIDGITSLAVLVGALGVLAGFRRADPIVGLLISVIILGIVKDAASSMWHRLMDAIDPEVLHDIEHAAEDAIAGVEGVHQVGDLRVRWLGHKLQAELSLTVNEDMSTKESHQHAEEVRHALYHARPQLTSIIIHVEPDGHSGDDPHGLTAHHRPEVSA